MELVRELEPRKSFREAEVTICEDFYPPQDAAERAASHRKLGNSLRQILPLLPQAQEQLDQLMAADLPLGALADIVSYLLDIDLKRKSRCYRSWTSTFAWEGSSKPQSGRQRYRRHAAIGGHLPARFQPQLVQCLSVRMVTAAMLAERAQRDRRSPPRHRTPNHATARSDGTILLDCAEEIPSFPRHYTREPRQTG